MTAGDGVSNQYRYGDLLEQHLHRVQVLNFALPGTGTDQQYLTFLECARHLEYDLLIIAPLVENIRRVISRYRLVLSTERDREKLMAKPFFTIEGDALALHHVPVPKGTFSEKDLSPQDYRHVDYGGPTPALRKAFRDRLMPFKSTLHPALSYRPVRQYDKVDDPAWLLMKAILKQWIAENGKRPAIILPIPLFPHIEQTESAKNYQLRFKELESNSVIICDPLPRFWAETRDNRRRCRFPSDPHFTPYGHQMMAEALLAVVAGVVENGSS
jgi:carbamoyltransferase